MMVVLITGGEQGRYTLKIVKINGQIDPLNFCCKYYLSGSFFVVDRCQAEMMMESSINDAIDGTNKVEER
jgi:hypothetical protein